MFLGDIIHTKFFEQSRQGISRLLAVAIAAFKRTRVEIKAVTPAILHALADQQARRLNQSRTALPAPTQLLRSLLDGQWLNPWPAPAPQ